MALQEFTKFARCRTCMEICFDLISLKEQVFPDKTNICVSSIVEFFFNEPIFNTQNLNICGKCFEEAKVAYLFSIKCKNTKELLKNFRSDNIMKPYTDVKHEKVEIPKIENVSNDAEGSSSSQKIPEERISNEESIENLSLKVISEEEDEKILKVVLEECSEATESTMEQEIAPVPNLASNKAVTAEACKPPLRKSTRVRNKNWSRFEVNHPESKRRVKQKTNEYQAVQKNATKKVKPLKKTENFKKDKIFNCKFCDKTFVSNMQYAVHCMMHLDPICVISKNSEKCLQAAKRDHVCAICSRVFYHRRNLMRHMDIHNKCGLCNFVPMNRNELRSHIESTHLRGSLEEANQSSVYECPFCKKEFNKLKLMTKHVKYECKMEMRQL